MNAVAPQIGLGISTLESGPADYLYGRVPWRWADLLALAQGATELGIDAVWLPDHLLYPYGEQERRGTWEAFSILSALAASTERIGLGVLVAAMGFRNPALLAKMAETIDEISGGRLVLGVGLGGRNRLEYDAFGFPFDHRIARFEEGLEVLSPLLRTGHGTFRGEYVQIDDCEIRPRGPRPEGIPLLIGTAKHGPRILELAARYADIWSGWLAAGNSWPEAIVPALPLVDAACRAVGRDPVSLRRMVTVNWVLPSADPATHNPGSKPLTGSIGEIAQTMRDFAALGIEQVQIIPNPCSVACLPSFEALMRELQC